MAKILLPDSVTGTALKNSDIDYCFSYNLPFLFLCWLNSD